jgi:enamine deaminase RidA (YjgF/YER057c/UK114 family)
VIVYSLPDPKGAVYPLGTPALDRSSIRNRLAQKKDSTVDRKQTAESLGVTFSKQEPGYLAMVVRSGQQLITSGHVSDLKGKLGSGLTVEEGQVAARQCAAKILNSVWNFHGSLEGLRVLKVLGCVNSTLEFHEQHLVINGCSDLLHSIFGKTTDGYHARSALGFAQLPTGAAVEVEAIFEILPS